MRVTLAAICMIQALSAATTAQAEPSGVTLSQSYSLDEVNERVWPRNPDIAPTDPAVRAEWAKMLAYDAAVYGTSPVLLYRQMHDQAVNSKNANYTGFNKFHHDPALADPDYKPFTTPNADTLYSNAWLNLSAGPVVLTVPDMGETYYTANFIDIYSNSSNISARTHGFRGARYLIVPAGWEGEVPEGMQKFTVATPYSWILLRILAANPEDVSAVQRLQAGFRIEPLKAGQALPAADTYPAPDTESAAEFFRILDWVLRANGHPEGEAALVYRYRGIGLGGAQAFETAAQDPAIRSGLEEGFKSAQGLIDSVRLLSGYPAGSWKVPADTGAWGYNYLYRATINTLGTGANLPTENYPFNTFVDGDGALFDGSAASYRLRLSPPPPAKFFWSVTLYDARTKKLAPNPIGRYVIGDRTKGLKREADGSVTIAIQADDPGQAQRSNWLPAPKGPFYLVIRAQGPEQKLLEGRWLPQPVERVKP